MCFALTYCNVVYINTTGTYKVTPTTYGQKLRESTLQAQAHDAAGAGANANANANASAAGFPPQLVRTNDDGDFVFTG